MADRQDASRPHTVADVINAAGAGPFVLACEHASNHVPAGFGNLGLDEATLRAHIAWDPGALAVASELARLLDAPLVAQRVSRLLYDCNRPPESADSVPEASEVYSIPGNQRLSAAQRADRATRFYHPFRTLLSETIERRARSGPDPVLVTIHSFTPIYFGVRRDVELGVLHDQDRSFADLVLAAARDDRGIVTRRNQPYGPADGVTHTLREHALPRGLPNVMIEIRNDLIASETSQKAMAGRLSAWLSAAHAAMIGKQREKAP